LNRLNTFILLFFSFILSFLVVFLFLSQTRKREPVTIVAPFKIEVYRVDRHPLPEADIYLNQRFIGRTDSKGFFSKAISLTVGEFYTLRIEKERDGYVYGPWETNFKAEEEKRRRRERKKVEEENIPTLEGESDILTEIERAQLGKASLYEKYHFLAFIDGYMFYSVRVLGKEDAVMEDAAVIINGKEEGKTDKEGTYVVKYSGDDIREEDIQVFKEGEHIWMNKVLVKPNSHIDIRLNQMLLIDLYIYSEYYDVIRGVEGVEVYLGDGYMGKTNDEGEFSFKYINESGVDGWLDLIIRYPTLFLPEQQKKTFLITKELPKLSVINFAYNIKASYPKVAVMPVGYKETGDYFLKRHAIDLRTAIEDYISSEGLFTVVSDRKVSELFRQFNIDYRRGDTSWKEIPLIKKELDAIIVGDISGGGNEMRVSFKSFDYTGESIFDVTRKVSLRELQSLSEEIVRRFKSNFPVEGNIISIEKKLYINLGKQHGIKKGNIFYGFIDFYDVAKKSYSKKRVVKLKIVDANRTFSEGDLESISEGYLLEAGVKVKRIVESMEKEKDIILTIDVLSGKKPVPEANVYLDDQWYGQTDRDGKLRVTAKSNINIDFLVYKEGYIPGVMSTKVSEETGVLRFELKRGKSTFKVSSQPEGALVFIDSEYKGTTPIIDKKLVVPYGFHLLELELKGYTKYKNYINFSTKRLDFIGENKILLFKDFLGPAEGEYTAGNIQKAITLLLGVPKTHPDYSEALELLGYIYLNDIKDFKKSIEYYSRALESSNLEFKAAENIFSYYNLGQAYFSEAERDFYSNKELAQYYFLQAVSNLDYVKVRKTKIPVHKRITVYQDTLFYLAVCYQKLYYLTLKSEYLSRAFYSWIDYFDFFPKDLLNDTYFRKQFKIAQSYREEVERLQGEE